MYNPSKPYKHEILRLIESTWATPHVRVKQGIYPILIKKFSGPEIQHTDGIGTKGHYHWRKRSFQNAVIDALAMNLNDLAMAGAVPYALQDHIVVPEAGSDAILQIVRALSMLCRAYKIAILGGESSHHNNADGIDISISVSGFVRYAPSSHFRAGDVLIGLKSSGLHSNGITCVRGMFGAEEWREDFIRPTHIYINAVFAILKKYKVNGMMHITGGAFTKLHDLLPRLDAHIEAPTSLLPQPIFHELYDRGVSDREMYTTFNCGIGFVLGVSPKDAPKILRMTPRSAIIGKVAKGTGKVHMLSAFSGKQIIL